MSDKRKAILAMGTHMKIACDAIVEARTLAASNSLFELSIDQLDDVLVEIADWRQSIAAALEACRA